MGLVWCLAPELYVWQCLKHWLRTFWVLELLYFKWSSSFLLIFFCTVEEMNNLNNGVNEICPCLCAWYIFSPFCSLVRHFVAFLRLMFSNRNRGHRLESKRNKVWNKGKDSEKCEKLETSVAFWGFWFTSSLHSVDHFSPLWWLGVALCTTLGPAFLLTFFVSCFCLLLTQDHCVFSISVVVMSMMSRPPWKAVQHPGSNVFTAFKADTDQRFASFCHVPNSRSFSFFLLVQNCKFQVGALTCPFEYSVRSARQDAIPLHLPAQTPPSLSFTRSLLHRHCQARLIGAYHRYAPWSHAWATQTSRASIQSRYQS